MMTTSAPVPYWYVDIYHKNSGGQPRTLSAIGNAVTKAWKLRIAVLWCFTVVFTGKHGVQSAINVISFKLYNLPFQMLEIEDRIGVITFYICQVSCLTYCIKLLCAYV